MKTKRLTDHIEEAAAVIRGGGLVAVPTETVYGLAGNGLDAAAVERIYEVKGRPMVKPLSLMVSGPEAFHALCREAPPAAYALAERFWPGPLTIVLPVKPGLLPSIVLAGGDTVGLRCPKSEKTLALLRACGLPLAAPSANPSGAESPRSAEDVLAYFDGVIDGVIDGGPCALGVESTLAALSPAGLTILRQGALSEMEIRRCLIDTLNIFGITGGTGSGKTTALEVLKEKGALVIDADAVYHELCAGNTAMLGEINGRFPSAVEEGVLQRKKLGALVFSDPAALGDLRKITDRYVEREIDRRLSDHAAAGGRIAAVDAINILDTNLMSYGITTVGITAPEQARAERLMAREGISLEYALKRIRAQHPSEWFEENCDYTIANDSDRETYRRRCEALFTKLLEE